ncbi:FliH/SctL family protein [Litoribacillus peritrichatus]|uniref:Flagellar assembly protein FliH n=1 Tax=Litoribacillus peritrichatus TaxID=718191 RepID=A0ABP7M808_9GAMM
MTNEIKQGRIPETGTMTAYERWELPSLDEIDEAANEVEIEPVTAEEVEQIRQDAFTEGYDQGSKKGYDEGLSSGKTEGHQQGLAEGTKEGQAKGFEQGLQQGLTKGQADVDAEVKKLSDVIQQFDQPLANLDQQVRDSLLNVITAVSRTVIHRELQTDSSQLNELLKHGLSQMEGTRDQIEMQVNPADLILVENAAEEAGSSWKITADESILPGGIKLKSGASLVDLTAEHRFQQAILNLLGRNDWAIDLAAGTATEEQKALTSLADGYDTDAETDFENSLEADATEAVSEDEQSSAPADGSLDDVHPDDLLDGNQADALADNQDEPADEGEVQVQTEALASENTDDELSDENPLASDLSQSNEPESSERISEDSSDVRTDAGSEHGSENSTESLEVDNNQHAAPDNGSDSDSTGNPDAQAIDASLSESGKTEPENAEAHVPEPSSEEQDSKVESPEAPSSHGVQDTSNTIDQEEGPVTPLSEEAPLMASDDESEEVFDFDAGQGDENTTVYPEKQTVSDLMKQEGDESASNAPDSGTGSDSNQMADPSAPQEQAHRADNINPQADNTNPEVQSMMQPVNQGNGFQAFGWQTPQMQAQQQAQMQANAASAQAQQAQMQAHQAQAQAQQAQAHAQAMSQQAHQANAQAQAQQMAYQPQYQPQQGYPYPGQQPGYQMQPNQPQFAPFVAPNVVPQGGMMPMAPQPMQGQMQPPVQNYQGMPVQPVPMVQQQNFSAYNFSANPQGNQPNGAGQAAPGFMPYPYPNA